MTQVGKLSLKLIPLSLALVLAGCNSDKEGDTEATGERIAPIAAPAGQTWADQVKETEEGGFVSGNPDAPIKLIEYASHTCSACAQFSEKASVPLRDDYVNSGRVSVEIRNQIHDPLDLTLAVMMRCGGAQSYFPLSEQAWANLNTFIGNIQANQTVYEQAMSQQGAARLQGIAQAAGLYEFFAERGISADQSKQCLQDEQTAQTIFDRSNTQSKELNVTGTPTFFLNGKNIGTQSWETLQPMLQNAGAR